MSEFILRNLNLFGLTPAQVIIACAIAWGWVTTLSPMPVEMAKLNDTVRLLSTKVEIHSVLISQITELNSEVKGMRRELSTIEGKLATASVYRPGKDSTP
ncbi:MAG: hypothetical protein QE570_14325 [Verrucomicrobiota bacterium]|jgi:hypothetical protein|nr:hypothetical protein [Verrucomicrobiota bacterium]